MKTPIDHPGSPPKALFLILGFWAVALMTLGWMRAWPDTIDDAHISFRYVENVVAGHGLSFNPGQVVEGYSNPLTVFLLIPVEALGLPLEAAMLMLGMVSFFFCAGASLRLVGRLGGAQWAQLLAGIAVLGHFPLLYYSVTGLETGVFAALIIGALWRYVERGGRVDGLGAVLWIGVLLSRPEGILYPAALGVWELSRAMRRRSAWTSVSWMLAVGAAFVAFSVWRRWYFGAWLPNTFLAKGPGTADLAPMVTWFDASSSYLLGFLYQLGILLPLCAGAVWIAKDLRSRLAPVWLMLGIGLVFAAYAGGDWMPAGRYLLPVASPMIVLGVLGLDVGWRRLRERGLGDAAVWLVALAGILSLAAPSSILLQFHARRDLYPYHVLSSRSARDSALLMREIYGPDNRIVAHRIGALGRFSGMEVIDLFGLVDRDIARIISASPSYHPSPHRGEDLPELRALLNEREPDLLLTIQIAPDPIPTLERYGYRYNADAVFQLGQDQWWVLYVRSR